MAVYFPGNTVELMSVFGAPAANGGVGLGKKRVRAEVSGGHHPASGQLGAMNPVIASKRFRYLRANFNQSIGIQIQREVASGTRESGSANK